MSFTCKNSYGCCIGKLSLKDTRNMYENAKYCKVCGMYVECYHKRYPCCNAQLRTKSKRHRRYHSVF